jgi:RimJ/RimL family protein N-acetyltransferase
VSELSLDPLTEALAVEAAGWFEGDDVGRREFGGFYGAHPKWWDLVRSDDERHGWVVRGDLGLLGFVDLETSEPGHISLYVRKEFRGRGLCPEVLRMAPDAARLLGAERVTAAVARTNSASLACCRRAGMVEIGTNEFGETVLELRLAAS